MWRWKTSFNDYIGALSFPYLVSPSKVRQWLSPGCTVSPFNTSSAIILFSSRRNVLHICKAWNVILLGLGPEFSVWMHKRGVKCNTFGLLTQFKSLATPARQVQTNEPRRAEQAPACTATADAPVGRGRTNSTHGFTQLQTTQTNIDTKVPDPAAHPQNRVPEIQNSWSEISWTDLRPFKGVSRAI